MRKWLPKLARPSRPPRQELPSGPSRQAGQTSEPVGLTLRQIQFRGPHRAAPQPSAGGHEGH
jgi:hypothetical protein